MTTTTTKPRPKNYKVKLSKKMKGKYPAEGIKLAEARFAMQDLKNSFDWKEFPRRLWRCFHYLCYNQQETRDESFKARKIIHPCGIKEC